MCLSDQSCSTSSTASQSSSSGWVGGSPCGAEVVGRGDEAAAEMVLPEAVDDDAGGERMVGPRQPLGQVEAAERRAGSAPPPDPIARAENRVRRPRTFLSKVAALEDVGESGRAVLGDGPGLGGKRRPLRFQRVGLPAQLRPLRPIRRRQGVHDLIPRHLEERLGLSRELLLFRRSLIRIHGQRIAVGRFQLRFLGLAQSLADGRLDVGGLLAKRRDLRVQLLVPALVFVALGPRGEIDFLRLGGAEERLQSGSNRPAGWGRTCGRGSGRSRRSGRGRPTPTRVGHLGRATSCRLTAASTLPLAW